METLKDIFFKSRFSVIEIVVLLMFMTSNSTSVSIFFGILLILTMAVSNIFNDLYMLEVKMSYNIGFYEKNNRDNCVVIFNNSNILSNKQDDITEELIDVINKEVSAVLSDNDIKLLVPIFEKYNISLEKLEELKKLYGKNIRYGILR